MMPMKRMLPLRAAAILLLAGAAACVSTPVAGPGIAGDGVPGAPGYRAGGNEPFWNLIFEEGSIGFFDLASGDTVTVARPAGERIDGGWRYRATGGEAAIDVRLVESRCNDTMSGRPFPHTVEVIVDGRRFTGCGGDTAGMLTSSEWTVTWIDGGDVPASAGITLHFSADGTLAGSSGCNRYTGRYELTGEGLSAGPLATTRMACMDEVVSAREARFLDLLQRMTRFDIDADGALRLLVLDDEVIRAAAAVE